MYLSNNLNALMRKRERQFFSFLFLLYIERTSTYVLEAVTHCYWTVQTFYKLRRVVTGELTLEMVVLTGGRSRTSKVKDSVYLIDCPQENTCSTYDSIAALPLTIDTFILAEHFDTI